MLFTYFIFVFMSNSAAKVNIIFLSCKFFAHFFDKMKEKVQFFLRFIAKRVLKLSSQICSYVFPVIIGSHVCLQCRNTGLVLVKQELHEDIV